MSSSKSNSKRNVVAAAAKAEAVAKASGVDLDGIRTNLANTKTKIAKQLSDIEEELVAKGADLKAIEQAIEAKTEEMAALHDRDNVLMAMDDLRVKLEGERKQFELQKASLVAEHARLTEEAATARQREEGEFRYMRDLKRKQDEDNWNAQIAQRKREEAVRVAEFEASQAVREKALADKEDAYTKAIALADTFDSRVQAETKKEVAIAENKLKKDHEHAVAMTKVQTDAQIINLEKDIKHRDETIDTLKAELAQVKEQLKAAVTAQSDLARAAVDNAKLQTGHAEAMATYTAVGAGAGNRNRQT